MRSRLGSAVDTLTRPRHHQLIDFLLGFAALIGFVAFVGKFSALFAIAAFGMVSVLYLVGLRRKEKAEQLAAVGVSGAGVQLPPLAALDELERKLSEAPSVPLTGRVRVDPLEVSRLVDDVRAAAQTSPLRSEVDQLAQLVSSGEPVPLTGQIQIDRDRAERLIRDLRTKLA